jgi:hypothetical protein
MIRNYFSIVITAIILLGCQKEDSKISQTQKIDEIEFSYINYKRIPFSEVKIVISRLHRKDTAVLFIQSWPASNDPKWAYSKIEKFMTIDLKDFQKFADSASSLDKINIDKAYQDGHDGSTWQIQFGSKGKNKSYSFWSPNYNKRERGLTTFVNLSEQIIEASKLKKEEILKD